MGYYIETPTNHNKAQFICTEHGGTIVENPEWDNLCPDEALIVVVGKSVV